MLATARPSCIYLSRVTVRDSLPGRFSPNVIDESISLEHAFDEL